MTLRFEAIRPRRKLIGDNALDALRQDLGPLGFAGEVLRDLADYPPAQPGIGERQSLGKRAGARTAKRTTLYRGYRRTGRYGRGWKLSFKSTGLRVESSTYTRVPYAVYVGGPRPGAKGHRQTDLMASRGWRNITAVAQRHWLGKYRTKVIRILTGRDPRTRPGAISQTG